MTKDNIDAIEYLNYFMREVLRLDPPAWFTFTQRARKDVLVKDIMVKKGTDIQINIPAVHRNKY